MTPEDHPTDPLQGARPLRITPAMMARSHQSMSDTFDPDAHPPIKAGGYCQETLPGDPGDIWAPTRCGMWPGHSGPHKAAGLGIVVDPATWGSVEEGDVA